MPALDGHLDLRADVRSTGQTVLARQGFAVPFHLSKPYWDPDHGVLMVQVANPTAGILSGDRLRSNIEVANGARLCVTTPSASRVFKMSDGQAIAEQRFAVESGGWLEVMPEPLVLHRESRFSQRTEVDVANEGGLFFADQLVPGRVGHGEVWEWERLRLDLWVRIDGKLVLRERIGQSGAELKALASSVGFGTSAAFANVVLISPSSVSDAGNPSWRQELKTLHADGVWCGVSALGPTIWSLRVIAPDGVSLRASMIRLRAILADAVPALRCNLRKL